MDAAERRIRKAGYNGFSFREIAADVGVKSASIHYHFPTKDALVAAVVHRYNERILEIVQAQVADGVSAVDAWRDVFRGALMSGAGMCLCGSLGAAAGDLMPAVVAEVRLFFEKGLASLTSGGLDRGSAARVLATLEGAILMASVAGDATIFDDATARLPEA